MCCAEEEAKVEVQPKKQAKQRGRGADSKADKQPKKAAVDANAGK